MEIKRLLNLDNEEFEQVSKIYLNSFPINETRPLEKTKSLLKNENYNLFIAKENDVQGIALLYIFEDFSLLDYIGVSEKYQRKGIGRKLFKHIIEYLENKENFKILLMEIRKEVSGNENDAKNRIDRIKFYDRLGAKILTDKYLLPPYQGNTVEEMYLIGVPFNEFREIHKEELLRYIREIYRKVYNYTKTDLEGKINLRLPEIIELKKLL